MASARIDADGPLLRVTLSRPEQRNPIDIEVVSVLAEAFGERARAPRVRAVVLRGEGPSFCSGLDRGLLGALAGRDAETIIEEGARLQAVFDAIAECPVPTLAVVQGACVGGGMALLLACDLRIAAGDARFSMMEMRYAFLPDLGHVHRLQRDVGMARAKEFLYFAGTVEAATLREWGVLNEVVDPGALDAAAAHWEQRCASAPPLAVAAVKRLLHSDPAGADGAASQRRALEENARTLLRSGDFREGLTAAMERRPAAFRGE